MRDGPSDLMQMKHDQAGTSGKSEKEHSVSVHPVLLEANSRLFHHAAYLESLSRVSDGEKRMERIKGGGGDEKGLKIRACRWRGICVHASNKVTWAFFLSVDYLWTSGELLDADESLCRCCRSCLCLIKPKLALGHRKPSNFFPRG